MALEILIVDDERDIRELVAGVLGDEGYACRTAADSTEALAAIDERRPSLVLLDEPAGGVNLTMLLQEAALDRLGERSRLSSSHML